MKKITEVLWDILPETYEEFLEEAGEKLYDPETAAALFICALRIFIRDQSEGIRCLKLITFNDSDDAPLYYPRLSQIAGKQAYLPDSYFENATAENGYSHPLPCKTVIKSDNAKGIRRDCKTVYIGCGGSGNFRPVTLVNISEEKIYASFRELKPENSMWFVKDFVSLLSDVKPPV